ncbi:MAG TPA: protease modulator HflC [Gammaproteobacteria bacterium]|jgi:membrane protease subunit HflC|nr:protease modulator HflC [Gammaproteobacteria bacterium]
MSAKWLAGLVATAIVLLLLDLAIFTVNPAQWALMLRFGKIVDTQFDPGIHFKAPFINQVVRLDKRVLTLDSPPERFLTVNKKNLLVDYFAKWQITDPVKFYRATGGNEDAARARLGEIVKNELRAQFGTRTVQQAVTGERAELMQDLRVEANKATSDFGVKIVDVRIKRIDLPTEVSGAVFDRMRSERAQVAKRYRAEGARLAEQIRAKADKQHTIIIADAQKKAQQIRGEGDAKAAAIYAVAYNKDPAFYAFYRSLRAYRASLKGDNSVLVLSPDSRFFQYLETPKGCGKSC